MYNIAYKDENRLNYTIKIHKIPVKSVIILSYHTIKKGWNRPTPLLNNYNLLTW